MNESDYFLWWLYVADYSNAETPTYPHVSS